LGNRSSNASSRLSTTQRLYFSSKLNKPTRPFALKEKSAAKMTLCARGHAAGSRKGSHFAALSEPARRHFFLQ
jgi:hypothetical protein